MTLLVNMDYEQRNAWERALPREWTAQERVRERIKQGFSELVPLLHNLLDHSPAMPVIRYLAGKPRATTAEASVAMAGLTRPLDLILMYCFLSAVEKRSSVYLNRLRAYGGHSLWRSFSRIDWGVAYPGGVDEELFHALRQSMLSETVVRAVRSYAYSFNSQ